MVMTMYADRVDAGRRLAELLTHHAGGRSIVLGLPRGGVPVALQVARRLHCPFDVLLVRKLGLPGQPELAMGAVGEGRVTVVNDDIVGHSGVADHQMHDAEKRARRVIEERATLYRCGRDAPDLHGKTAIIVDDGVATGATARAACQVARLRGARHVVLAVPVAPAGWEKDFRGIVDETVCPLTPDDFLSVGEHYGDFRQVADSEVVSAVVGSQSASCDTDVVIDADGASLRGHLTVPLGATGCVVFAHGSGSSRRSPRNVWVAARLQSRGLATLLFDLLTEREARERHFVFDIELLTRRLVAAVDWVRVRRETSGLSVGLFGASTGAAAALAAAAAEPTRVSAVVSRGGRPDLAWDRLSSVTQPVLFVVGGRDLEVLDLTRRSAERLAGPRVLSVVGAAGHLFEEPGALQQVADEAGKFFEMHLH